MVNGKRVIALCASKDGSEETVNYINRFYEMARERDYVCICYSMSSDIFGRMNESSRAYHMVNTINFDFIDAVIILKDYAFADEVIDEIVNEAERRDIPRVVVGATRENAFSIQFQGDNCFEGIIRHIVEHHRCRNVYCMAGVKNAPYTKAWLDIYKKVLWENGIAYDEAKVGYGEYWAIPTYDQVDEWAKSWSDKSDVPDAIICTGDSMAVAVCDKLHELGYLVPENIIVTGFEGSTQGRYYYPRITTAEKDDVSVCDIVAEVLETAFATGDFVKMNMSQQYTLKTYESCGCKIMPKNYATEVVNMLYNRHEANRGHEKYIFGMVGKTTEAGDKQELAKIYSQYLHPNSYIAFRTGAFSDEDISTAIEFDSEMDVITPGTGNLKTGQKRNFPLDIYFPDYETLDHIDNLIMVYPITFEEKLFGYYVSMGYNDPNSYAANNRFVNLTNICCNMVRVNSKFKQANSDLLEHQIREGLTGLLNMKGFIKNIEEQYFSNVDGRKLVLVALDIERLKGINEGFGHEEGDKALITVANILRSNASTDDIVAKYGIDEFLVAIFTKEDPEFVVYNFLNGVFASLKNHNKLNTKHYNLGLNTAYVIESPKNATDLDEVIKRVSNKKRLLKSGQPDAASRGISEQDKEDYKIFNDIISRNDIRYMFQPIVDARTGDIHAYEALMRTAPEVNMSPVRMVELAMKYNRLDDIEKATMNNVFEYVNKNKELFKDKKVFLNSIITNSMTKEEFDILLAKYPDTKANMVVEVTEHTDVPIEKYKAIEKYLSNHGVQIAIDDYGTGYANTVRLMQYSPSYVKIDRVLINGIHSDFKKQHFVENIINYAHKYGFMAIAEGVETSSELKTMLMMDVDLIQGYYTARPSFEVVSSIKQEVKLEILKDLETINGNVLRRTYVTGDDTEVYTSELEVSQYTEILVSRPSIKIIGQEDMMSQMNIKLEDDKDYEITLENIHFNPNFVDEVVNIGENSNVHLIFKGKNRFEGKGIAVPESSNLKISGTGSLKINAAALYGYGIGNTFKRSHGNISIELPAGLSITTEGDNGIAIGAGSNESDAKIEIINTKLDVSVASIKSIGIGSCFDRANIMVKNSKISGAVKGRVACGMGSIDGEVNINVDDSDIKFISSGDLITGIGAIRDTKGTINIENSKINVDLNGKEGCCIGSDTGNIDITVKDTRYRFTGEGASMLTIGTRSKEGSIKLIGVKEEISVTSANHINYGVEDGRLEII